jgi:Zn-dependent protease/predicted transcriptional regulator
VTGTDARNPRAAYSQKTMPGRSIRIARIAGIPVGISPWWLVIVAVFTWVLGAEYFPEAVHGIAPAASYALGFVSVLLLFVSILAHEFGHALVARKSGIEIEEIDLWLLGGVSRMRGEAHDPQDELRYAIAGPAVTAVIAACFGIAAALLPSSTPQAVRALIEYQAFVNVAILVLNLLPAFPLDGGRVLRSLMWRRSGEVGRATERAASIGRGFGYVMIALGGIELLSGAPGGLWLALIGVFIVMAAGQQAMGAQVQAALSGVSARELMSSPVVSIPERTSATEASRDWFVPYRYVSFPVVDDDGRAIGLVSLPQIERLSRQQRATSWVGEIAERDTGLLVSGDEDVLRLLDRPAFIRVGRAVVIDEEQRPIGLVSITDVQRTLRASQLADDGGTRTGERSHATTG